MEIKHEKTKEILQVFEEISKIPRCSKNEAQIAQWLTDWAKGHNFVVKSDKVDNILIKVPASPGYENSTTVVLQGHLDMVCEKTPDSGHDFSKDPIQFVYEDEWLTANKTTLGADNGIAIAMAMVAALDEKAPHPPLELLFTVDEETGLTGATSLEPGFLEGKILINIDSEDEGVFTVGCAGGMDTALTLPLSYENLGSGYGLFKISAGGMKGGHSGIDIALGKANAVLVLARALKKISEEVDLRIINLQGGSAHNAIPRDAEALVALPSADKDKALKILKEIESVIQFEFKKTDSDLFVKITGSSDSSSKMLQAGSNEKLINFLLAVPHGVYAMSPDIDGLVETSNNYASIKIEDDKVKVLTSQRSSIISRIKAITQKIEAVVKIAGGEAHSGGGYPPWPPNMDSPLLAQSVKLYKKMFNKEPVVEIIHAGLECGIIGDKYPGMDMISIGPTLKYPHSPDEKIHVGSIGKVWDFILELLKDLK